MCKLHILIASFCRAKANIQLETFFRFVAGILGMPTGEYIYADKLLNTLKEKAKNK